MTVMTPLTTKCTEDLGPLSAKTTGVGHGTARSLRDRAPLASTKINAPKVKGASHAHKANKKPAAPAAIDKYVKYIYEKKKLNVHLGAHDGAQGQGSAAIFTRRASCLKEITPAKQQNESLIKKKKKNFISIFKSRFKVR
jgi:hypothetical protein